MSTRAACCTLQGAVLLGRGSCWSQQPAKPFGFECRKDVRKHCSYFWFWWLFFSLPLFFHIAASVEFGSDDRSRFVLFSVENKPRARAVRCAPHSALQGDTQRAVSSALPAPPVGVGHSNARGAPQLTPPKCSEQPGSELKYHAALLCFCF